MRMSSRRVYFPTSASRLHRILSWSLEDEIARSWHFAFISVGFGASWTVGLLRHRKKNRKGRAAADPAAGCLNMTVAGRYKCAGYPKSQSGSDGTAVPRAAIETLPDPIAILPRQSDTVILD